MGYTPVKLITLCISFCCGMAGYGQSTNSRIETWIKELSVKEDIRSVKLQWVHDQLEGIDSVERCLLITELDKRSKDRSPQLQIRILLLKAKSTCPVLWQEPKVLEEALRKAYEIEDHFLSEELNRLLGQVYFSTGDLGLAVMYKYKANEIRKSKGEHLFRNVADDLLQLGNYLYQARDYKEAVRFSNEALQYHVNPGIDPSDTLNRYWQMNAWNNLGLAYERLEVYDSALVAFDKALAVSDNPFWTGLLKGNRGDVFFFQGRYDSAEALLQIDYEQSLAAKQYDNASISLQRLARIYNSRGQHSRALTMLREADALEKRMRYSDYRAQLLYAYALIYKDLDNADSSFYYMQQHMKVKDELDKIAALNRTEFAELRMQNQDNVYRILELSKEKRRITLIRNFTIALILVSSILALVYTNRLRLKAKLRQHEALQAKRTAELDAENARKQLSEFTESLRKKTKLIEDLQSNMEKKELDHEQTIQIQKLTESTILTDADWEQFKLLFTRVYPGFFVDLKRKVTDITLAEQRMAALIKLQVSNKDATHMLGVSLNSIHKTRQRLRQRLGFENDEDLEKYLMTSPHG